MSTRKILLVSSISSCLTIVLLLYFMASHHNAKAPRSLNSNMEIEIAPRLPDKYVEPYRVKYDFDLNRLNSSRMPSTMVNSEHATLMETLRQMCRLFGANDIKWMMTDGSMIGSLRHWDIVPWDDDFDIIVNLKDLDKVIKLLDSKTVRKEYGLSWNLNKSGFIVMIKLYASNALTIKKTETENFRHKWPFVDIFFYSENGTHMWYKNVNNKKNFVSLDSVFPLQLRPMGDFWFPVVRKPYAYVDTFYPEGINDKCFRSLWSHRLEKSQQVIKVSCTDLKKDYFFVSRECTEGYCLEKLMRGGVAFKQILFPFY